MSPQPFSKVVFGAVNRGSLVIDHEPEVLRAYRPILNPSEEKNTRIKSPSLGRKGSIPVEGNGKRRTKVSVRLPVRHVEKE